MKFPLLRNLIPGALLSGLKPQLSALLFLSLLLGSSEASASDDPQLREIMEKHVEAMGGWRNWNQVESIRLSGTIERQGQTVDFVIIKKRPDQIRATITVPIPGKEDEALQVIRAHDGDSAWTATRPAGGKDFVSKALEGEAAASLASDSGVLPKLIRLWQHGSHLSVEGHVSIDNVPALRIRAEDDRKSGFYTFNLSLEDYRLLGYDYQEPDGTSENTRILSYDESNGVFIPVETVVTSSKTGESLISVDSTGVGVGIYRQYFVSEPEGGVTKAE